jgi:hypothetical protein
MRMTPLLDLSQPVLEAIAVAEAAKSAWKPQ